jgi:hypothetical protein
MAPGQGTRLLIEFPGKVPRPLSVTRPKSEMRPTTADSVKIAGFGVDFSIYQAVDAG